MKLLFLVLCFLASNVFAQQPNVTIFAGTFDGSGEGHFARDGWRMEKDGWTGTFYVIFDINDKDRSAKVAFQHKTAQKPSVILDNCTRSGRIIICMAVAGLCDEIDTFSIADGQVMTLQKTRVCKTPAGQYNDSIVQAVGTLNLISSQ